MNRRNLVFFLFLLVGLGVCNYPFISQWVNQQSESQAVVQYTQETSRLPNETLTQMMADAKAYNRDLAGSQQQLTDGFDRLEIRDEQYESLLNPGGDGVMGYVEIPAIDVLLPIRHGTGVVALEQGAGHLIQSSLPVGGESTHAVLSAHTGLASKALFTDLDQLQEGDQFYLTVLDQKLAYQVCDIQVVLPTETEPLAIVEGEDLVTLVTCTPYGINSHRLLVTGARVELEEEGEESTIQAQTQAEGKWVWSQRAFAASVVVLVIAGIVLLKPEGKGRKRNDEENPNDH